MLELSPDVKVGTLIDELYLKPAGLSLSEAADLCQLPADEFSKILTGDLPMNHRRALSLSRGFNTHISFFQRYIPKKSSNN